jgi:hypothetical protein
MNQLFEEFIAEFIRRELREVWQSRGWTLHAQSGARYLLCDETGNSRLFLRQFGVHSVNRSFCSLVDDYPTLSR